MPDDPQAAPGGPPDPSTNQARGSFGVGEPRRVETRSTGVKGRTFTDEIHESFASLGHPRAADQWTAEEARTFADEIQEFLADASLCRDPDEWTAQDVVNVLEIMGDRLTDSATLVALALLRPSDDHGREVQSDGPLLLTAESAPGFPPTQREAGHEYHDDLPRVAPKEREGRMSAAVEAFSDADLEAISRGIGQMTGRARS